MNKFQNYLDEKKVKKVSPDPVLANSLLKSSEKREKITFQLDIKIFYLLVFENIYDCLRELLDAILILEGYKSYSHEACIAYLEKFKFREDYLFQLDNFRRKRNDSKYYGFSASVDDALEITEFFKKIKPILINLIKTKLKQS